MNNYSNIIDIPGALEGIENYVVIKKSDYFPNYYDFNDVDIFCSNRESFIKKLKVNLSKQIGSEFRVHVTKKKYNTHVDIFPPDANRLNLRFDVYDSFPYQKFYTNPYYFLYILHNKKTIKYSDIEILLPCDLDDIIIRFFEWKEKPEKTKHLLYVKKHLKEYPNFIKTVKQYTNISERSLDVLKFNSTTRYDNFIIWGNGIPFSPQIVEMIREDPNFDIITMKRFHTGDMGTFIKKIYDCDPYPWEHLVAKTQYLLKSKQEIIFILVKNKNPKEIVKGKGEFEHLECTNVINLKIAIRNMFNPKWTPSRALAPLNPGVSHDHCIHGSDHEGQTEHILNVLGLRSLNFYKRNEEKDYYFPYHIDYVLPEIVEKNINELRANIIDIGTMPIESTPHFKYVCGEKEEYIKYFYNNFGTKLCEDHFPENFDKLINNFNFDYMRDDGRESALIINSANVILDGVHRLDIKKKLSYNKAKCFQI